MAHIVGVPKRDPCQKCGLPVFLAERLMIGKNVYHRTCLRCARCNSQLTPGNFYETEIDGEYCCETCPDEEKKLDVATSSKDRVLDSVNSKPIAARLAFFEKDGTKVLQKSLSDEEKSQSLKKLTENQLQYIYKPNSARSSFLNISLSGDSDSHHSSRRNSDSSNDTTSSDKTNDDTLQEPPELPKSLPPLISEDETYSSSSVNVQTSIRSKIDEENIQAKTVICGMSSEGQLLSPKQSVVNAHKSDSKAENVEIEKEVPATIPEQINMPNMESIQIKTYLHDATFPNRQASLKPLNSSTFRYKGGAGEIVENVEETHSEQLISCEAESNDNNDLISEGPLKSESKFENKNKSDISGPESLEINSNTTENVDITGINSDSYGEIPQQIPIPDIGKIQVETDICGESQNIESTKIGIEILSQEPLRVVGTNDNMNLKSQSPRKIVSISTTENVEIEGIKSNICGEQEIENPKTEVQMQIDVEPFRESSKKSCMLNIEKTQIGKPKSTTEPLDQQQDINVEFCNDHNLSIHSINVTKDNSENDGQMGTISVPTTVECIKELPTIDSQQPVVDSKSCKSMVRTRLHQFEDIANKSQNSSISSLSKNRLSHCTNSRRTSNIEGPQSDETELNVVALGCSNNSSVIDSISNEMEKDASYTCTQKISEKESSVLNIENQCDLSKTDMKPCSDELDTTEKLDKLDKSSDTSYKLGTLDKFDESDNSDKSDKSDKSGKSDKSALKVRIEMKKGDDYPEELNPFKSDEDEDNQNSPRKTNPFESSDEDEDKQQMKITSTNPFGSESEDDNVSSRAAKLPVPTPRTTKSSEKGTPVAFQKSVWRACEGVLQNTQDCCGTGHLDHFQDVKSSEKSTYCGCTEGVTKNRKKKPAPQPPKVSKEIFSPINQDSKKSSPGSSTASTPTTLRKKRPAPAPPGQSKGEGCIREKSNLLLPSMETAPAPEEEMKLEKPQAQLEKLCDEEKALLENSANVSSNETSNTTLDQGNEITKTSKRRLIALDASLVDDANSSEDIKLKEEDNVVYRRTLVPPALDDSNLSPSSDTSESHDRQLEKMKDNKEAKNRNRQSQISLPSEENDPLYNKSIHGKWKRRKGPAPALPIPPKKVLQMLPLQEIRHELEIIEVQQQGLEKQGVMLEKMIRERCEGPPGVENIEGNQNPPNSKEVEDLILQLFELVNEKNELFRRQAELMYLRRQHRLEQEQADLEYEIRVLMAQPERNKTDSDKAREEALIARLVEVVQLRNEVVECLEMDRLREAEEDLSIKQRLEMHSAKRDEELSKQTPTKLSKKEKKKQKEHKKIGKSKKLDADKDADESELNAEKQKAKKKKKKFLF